MVGVNLVLVVGLFGAPASGAVAGPGGAGGDRTALPDVRTVDPARLRRGADAAFPFLQGRRIHVGGRTVRVRLRAERGRRALLGRSDGAWIVASQHERRLRVHRVRRGRAPQAVPRSRLRGHGVSARLSRDGGQLLLTHWDRGGATVTVRSTSDGALVDRDYTGTYHVAVDAADGHALLLREAPEDDYETYAADWVPGEGTSTRLGTGLNAGFLRQGVVFVQAGEGSPRYGPTSIESPADPAWSARFVARSVSPDGTLVIGTGPRLVDRRAVLQVRRVSDGTVLQQFAYGAVVPRGDYWNPLGSEATARFETDTRFVFEFVTGRKSRLVRCSTAGRCARASGAGARVSAAFEPFMW